MLTEHEQEQIAQGIMPMSRIEALLFALRNMRDDTANRVHQVEDEGADDRYIASLRGKRVAYQECARMVEQIMDGKSLHPPVWSTARRKAQAFADRKYRRRAIKYFTPEQMAQLEALERAQLDES